MNGCEIKAILNTCAEYTRSVDEDELLSFIQDSAKQELIAAIHEDPRFICICDGNKGEELFISKKALSLWYVKINVRLAIAKVPTLDSQRMALFMSSLRLQGRWYSPPTELIDFGKNFYFVASTYGSDKYFFPLARLMSFLSIGKIHVCQQILDSLAQNQELQPPTKNQVQELFAKCFDILTPRERNVIQKREGLFGKLCTLEEIGRELELTRERIRQIENKAWKRLNHPKYNYQFVATLIMDFMYRRGSLLIDYSPANRFRIVIMRRSGIPVVDLYPINSGLVGSDDKEFRIPTDAWKYVFEPDVFLEHLQLNNGLIMASDDLKTLSNKLTQRLTAKLSKRQRVYLALRSIGEHAHASEITEVHNYLFPKKKSSEHNIHAVLSYEKYGVVWIGVRGTFALKEWGYEHPAQTLFETVSSIVRQKYHETGKPVPLVVVQAEIGKFRRVVNPDSLTIATYCNTELEHIGGQYFVPKEPTSKTEKDSGLSSDTLDRILSEFEDSTAKGNEEPHKNQPEFNH